ncbi:fructose PTS transporter subunit IIB, partial [Mycoplasma marinum]
NKKNIIISNQNLTQRELFEKIALLAEQLGVVDSFEDVKTSLLERESQGTTGFEEGFAIPHGRSEKIKKPQIFFYRQKEKIGNWNSLDGQGVTKAIFLLVPMNSKNTHMEILSNIAMKLMDDDFKWMLSNGKKSDIYKGLNGALSKADIEEDIQTDIAIKDKFFVAITACPAGIVKTFMAKERLLQVAKKMGYSLHVETQGGGILKNEMSQQQIDDAEFVIIASEIDISTDRFKGKKLVVTKTKDAINNAENLIKRAEKSNVFEGKLETKNKGLASIFKDMKSTLLSEFNKPWFYLVILATFYAMTNLIGYAMYSDNWFIDGAGKNQTLYSLQTISVFGFHLCMSVFAGIFARKFYDKSETFLIAFIFTFILNTPIIGTITTIGIKPKDTTIKMWFSYGGAFNIENMIGTSLFGGVLFAPVIAKVIKFMDFFRGKHLKRETTKVLFTHWIKTIVYAFIFTAAYFLGAPLSWMFQWVVKGLVIYPNSYWWLRFIIGGIFGILITYDYGGTTNKLTILFLIGMTQYDWRMRTLFAVAIPIASLSCALFFKLMKKWVKNEDLPIMLNIFKLGRRGLSEGPVELVGKYGWKAHLPSLVTAFIATGMIYVLNIQVFNGGGIGVLSLGAQGHVGVDIVNSTMSNPLIITNDVSWLNAIINPDNQSIAITIIYSFLYGIIGYYLVHILGVITYIFIASITMNIGKKKPFDFKKGKEVLNAK